MTTLEKILIGKISVLPTNAGFAHIDTVTELDGYAVVVYKNGVIRSFPMDKLPGSVRSFLFWGIVDGRYCLTNEYHIPTCFSRDAFIEFERECKECNIGISK